MHKAVIDFINSKRIEFPRYFENVKVLDCGSLDINGNNRRFFKNCEYTGIDIVKGKNVDVVCEVHNFLPEIKEVYDVVISTEMLEHDKHYIESLKTMYRLLKKGGLLLITAAGEGREEHGTSKRLPKDSPLTNDYYQNITMQMLMQGLNISTERFLYYPEVVINKSIGDIYFVGIKK